MNKALVSLRSLCLLILVVAGTAIGAIESLRRMAPSDGSHFDQLSFETTLLALEPRSLDDHATVHIRLLNRTDKNLSVHQITGCNGFGTEARVAPTSAIIQPAGSVDVLLEFTPIREGRNWYQLHAVGTSDVAHCEIVFDGIRKPQTEAKDAAQ